MHCHFLPIRLDGLGKGVALIAILILEHGVDVAAIFEKHVDNVNRSPSGSVNQVGGPIFVLVVTTGTVLH